MAEEEAAATAAQERLLSGVDLQAIKDGLDLDNIEHDIEDDDQQATTTPWEARATAAQGLIEVAQQKRLSLGDFGNVLFVLLEGFASPVPTAGAMELQVLSCHHTALAALRALVKYYPASFNGFVDVSE